MKYHSSLILTNLLLLAILMMIPAKLIFSAPPMQNSSSISITGAMVPEGGVEVQYTISYSGVTSTGGVQLVISNTVFGSTGFQLLSVNPPPNSPDNDETRRIWRYEDLDQSGSGTITITGIFNDPNTCNDSITFDVSILESHPDPNSGIVDDNLTATVACNVTGPAGCEAPTVWSVGDGDWFGGGQWNTGQVPGEDDIVWIRPGDELRLYGNNDTLAVKSLCNQGTIFSHQSHSLIIEASDFVTNYPGGILRGEDGEATTGNQGSTVMIQSPTVDPDGVKITNRGQILGGDGATGADFGGPGGSVALLGNYVENKGTIIAGRGGNLTGIDSGVAGDGGSITIWGTGGIYLRNQIHAGNGGNGNPGATAPQDGGNAGCVWIMGRTVLDLRSSHIRAGRPGYPVAGGFRGERCGVFIDPPESIDIRGADIEGDVVELYGGDDTDINASGGVTETTIISATQGITIAVGISGTIDLSNNDSLEIHVTGENGQVVVASDNEPILDGGESLENVVDEGAVVDEESVVLRHVSVVAPEVTGADAGVPVTLTLAIQNNGPDDDSYNVTFEAKYDWPREVYGLTNPVTVEGLGQHEFQMTVTPMDTHGFIATEIITITATSTDGEIIGQEVTQIHVKEPPVPNAITLTNSEVISNRLWYLPALALLLVGGLLLAGGRMALAGKK